MFIPENFFDLSQTIAKDIFSSIQYSWEVLPRINQFILSFGESLPKDKFIKTKENVWISKDARVFDSAYIDGPTIVCAGAEVRHCAFIRGNAIIGENVVVGNSTEIKNSILFNEVQVPHYNYVGDSILGYKAHMGAGSITSNVKSDRTLITIKSEIGRLDTNLKKFGAIVADRVEIGCNAVLNPGTIIGKDSTIYPLLSVRGIIPSNSIYKSKDVIVQKFL